MAQIFKSYFNISKSGNVMW